MVAQTAKLQKQIVSLGEENKRHRLEVADLTEAAKV